MASERDKYTNIDDLDSEENLNIPSPDELNLDTQNKDKLSPETQKYLTDVSPLMRVFYQTFCGYRFMYMPIEVPTLSGKKKIEYTEKIIIDKEARICNEAGASYLQGQINLLISPLTQSSKLSSKQIYKLWRGRLRALEFDLLDKYYLHNNPFDFKDSSIFNIVTILAQGIAITQKSEGGFTLEKFADTFMTATIQRTGIDTSAKKGAIDRIKSAISGR